MSCGVGHRRGSDPVLLWLRCRLVATAPIQPLAWEDPDAVGAAQEMAKRQKRKKSTTMNAGEGVEKREPSYPAVGNINWCTHYGKEYGDSSKKLKIELPYDPAIPTLGIYPKKTII